jgi:HEAT repeat protein
MGTLAAQIRSMAWMALAIICVEEPAEATDLDTIREQDPPLGAVDPGPPVVKFHPRLKSLWLEALARPEADLKRQAADAIAKAHPLGMPGLNEATPQLVADLDATNTSPVVRLAVARALIALDAKAAAPSLMKYARSGDADAARLIEPALARWDHTPMKAVWLARLVDVKTPRGDLLLAVRASGVIKLADAAPHLRRLALDTRIAGELRLESARTLAIVQPTGLEADARALATDASPQHLLSRLVAATLLTNHRGASAEEVLFRLAADRESAVAAIAVSRLLELDPVLLKSLYDRLAKSSDSTLRKLAARGLAELKTPEAVERLAPLLADPHTDVRVFAREALIRLAGTESLREAVRKGVTQVLGGNDPRGLEQAAIVAGAIHHELTADRLVTLLPHQSGEVRIASAWALRRLALPATADRILERVRVLTERGAAAAPKEPEGAVLYRDLEHLIEALGVLRHKPADAILRKYIPPPPAPLPPGVISPVWLPHLRAAAVWSLGCIKAADPDSQLVADLRVRLINDGTNVRTMAAVALGRMKVKEAVADLRKLHQDADVGLELRRACGWAVGIITGEQVPLLPAGKAREVWSGNWFLEPIGP